MTTHPTNEAPTTVTCPVCGGENDADNVFCANPECGKALGRLRYVLEEAPARRRWHERTADRVVRFVGQSHFIVVHVLWFGLWISINLGIVNIGRPFDAYPFGLLGLLLSVEAILLSVFVLISQSGERAYADTEAELDYEANTRMQRRVEEIERLLRQVVTQRADEGVRRE